MTLVFDKSASLAGTTDSDGNSNINIRQRVPKATLSAASGTACQLTLLFGTDCPTSLALNTLYFGQSDQGANSIKFSGDQVQVKFSGGATVNGGAALVVTSDQFTLAQSFDNTKDYLLATHFNNGTGASVSIATVSGMDLWVSTVGADESSVTNPTGSYTDFPNTLGLLEQITIISAGGGATVTSTMPRFVLLKMEDQ